MESGLTASGIVMIEPCDSSQSSAILGRPHQTVNSSLANIVIIVIRLEGHNSGTTMDKAAGQQGGQTHS
jgi:hypothetical protein